ncbi:UNVERIFIED_CONTAM: hypothetical protein GTU68_040724 [Idotea baltica]|nr:hypothetical protein [Idotea baltica]
MGKSGAGKSTLLQILGTLDNPDQGKVYIDDHLISELGSKELAKLRNEKIGFVFQFHHLLNEFSALENVAIPAMVHAGNKNQAFEKAKELLDYLELSHRLEHKPHEMSGGEQQRVAFARALVNNPKVVFADEPTGNLDRGTSDEVHSLIKKLKTELNQTFVIVTHDSYLSEICDITFNIDAGRIVDLPSL